MADEIEMKACPMPECGGTAVILPKNPEIEGDAWNGVECGKCGFEGETVYEDDKRMEWGEQKNLACKLWDDIPRAPSPSTDWKAMAGAADKMAEQAISAMDYYARLNNEPLRTHDGLRAAVKKYQETKAQAPVRAPSKLEEAAREALSAMCTTMLVGQEYTAGEARVKTEQAIANLKSALGER